LAVIALASTDVASQESTDSVLLGLLDWILPGSGTGGASSDDFSGLSWTVRKIAHILEYAILAILLVRAARVFPCFDRAIGGSGKGRDRGDGGHGRDWPSGAGDGSDGGAAGAGGRQRFLVMAAVVMPFGVVVALLDEFHQTFLSSRTGSLEDALIDVAGLLLGLTVAWLMGRRRLRESG
jgi:VanZ family protein